MTLRLSIADMRNALRVPSKERNKGWAAMNCVLSRYIHVHVWRICPEYKYVKSEIIPLLEKAEKGTLVLLKKKSISKNDKKSIGGYAENIGLRLKNIKMNYLKGKPSNFVPEDKLIGRKSAVG